MLHWLIQSNLDALTDHGFGFLRVFLFPTFQAAAAAALCFLLSLALGPGMIRWLKLKKIGDNPEFDNASLNTLMAGKRDTPTMGGLLIVGVICGVTLLLADLSNFYVQMALIALLWLGGIGMVDDWLKLTAKRRAAEGKVSRDGLRSKEKLLLQIGIAVLLAVFTWRYGQNIDEVRTLYVPFFKDFALPLASWLFITIATVVIVGTSNAVNLTDGLDGLAAGTCGIVAFAFLVLAFIVGDADTASALLFHHIPAASQMTVLAGAMIGACLGFLWFNCSPAQVFMGDTGSLALGGLIGYLAIVLRQELMLFLIGGIFVAEAVSVILQVNYFKLTRWQSGEGKRLFRMAPIHHHFQKLGWTETQVVVRFWLIAAMLAALAVATVKLR